MKDSLAARQSGSIRVVMITRDHVDTARAIAGRLGIGATPDAPNSGPHGRRLLAGPLEDGPSRAVEQRHLD